MIQKKLTNKLSNLERNIYEYLILLFWLLSDLGQLWLSVLSSQKYKPMKFCQAQTRTLQRKSFNIIRKMIQARLRTKLLKAANSTRDKKGRYSNHSQKYKTLERSNLQNFIPLSYQFRRIWRKMTLLKISCSFSCLWPTIDHHESNHASWIALSTHQTEKPKHWIPANSMGLHAGGVLAFVQWGSREHIKEALIRQSTLLWIY